jgi:type IV pilus assembly protein PilC
MIFSGRLSLPALIELCRCMRYSLLSGMMLRDTMDLVANRGTRPLRPVAARITADLKAGWGLQEALKKQQAAFPPLFLALTAVGEESGNLPEVLHELEKYYEMQLKLRRDFIAEISWPAVQFVIAVLVITGMILVLGIVAPTGRAGGEPFDPLGLGLLGSEGALKFLGLVFGPLVGLWIGFSWLKHLLRRRAIVERVLLWVPVLGSSLCALAMTRFCISLRLMLETSLSITKTLRLALQATDNAAFFTAAPRVEAHLMRGHSITRSVTAARVVPKAFLNVLAIAEECGRIPDMCQHQGQFYEDLARRRLRLLNLVAGWVVWLSVAGFIVFSVFRIFLVAYLGSIERNLPK